MNQRGVYGQARIGAEPHAPVRKVLLDALEKLKRDRQGFATKLQESEARQKFALDRQATFEQPITDDVHRFQFEALQRESSAAAADAVAARKSLVHVDEQIADLSARIAKAIPPTPPPPSREVPHAPPKAPPPPTQATPTQEQAPVEPVEEDKWGSIKKGAYVAGAVVIGGLLIVAVARGSRART